MIVKTFLPRLKTQKKKNIRVSWRMENPVACAATTWDADPIDCTEELG